MNTTSSTPLSWARGPGLGVVLFAAVFAAGTAGYAAIEGWSLWDSAFMTLITVTTVGYGYPHPLSRAGEGWTAFVLLGGVATLYYTAFVLMALIVDGGLHRGFEQRRFKRMLDALNNHFIICGYGRIGSTVAAQFRREKVPFVVIDRDPVRVQAALDDGALAIEADASREDALRRVGIERARGLIAVVGTDAENVYAVLSAHDMCPGLFVISRAETEDAVQKLKRAGANRVISPYQIGAVQIAQTALRPAVVDFVELATSSSNLELAIEQIPVSSGSPLAARTIVEANLRQRVGVIVVGIQRKDQTMEFNPEPDTAIRAGDQLVVLGRPGSLRRLEDEALA